MSEKRPRSGNGGNGINAMGRSTAKKVALNSGLVANVEPVVNSGLVANVEPVVNSGLVEPAGKVVIGSYNMSFASDLGQVPNPPGKDLATFRQESEAAHLLSIGDPANISIDRRKYWKNSLDKLKSFWTNPKTVMIGLQEMNKTAGGSTGSSAVENALKAIRPTTAVITDEIVLPYGKPALSIAWDTSVLGNYVAHQIFDLDYDPIEIKNQLGYDTPSAADLPIAPRKNFGKQGGRPDMYVLTHTGSVLCTLHAPNYGINPVQVDEATLEKLIPTDLLNAIQTNLATFLNSSTDPAFLEAKAKINGSRIFITGDFNDRLDLVQEIKITVNGAEYILKYGGKAPKSCCHNWDSSCTDERYIETVAGKGVGTCRVPAERVSAGAGERFLLEEEGHIKNYRYRGDKTFGRDPTGDLVIYQDTENKGLSVQGDHEAVACEYNITIYAGGRRRKGRKTQKKNRKAKKSRKVKRHNH